MIIVTVRLVVKPDCGEQFEAAVREQAAATRLEDGCDFYEYFRSIDSSDTYFFYEEWRDADAHAAHTQTPHVVKFFATAPELVAESKIQMHDVAGTRLL